MKRFITTIYIGIITITLATVFALPAGAAPGTTTIVSNIITKGPWVDLRAYGGKSGAGIDNTAALNAATAAAMITGSPLVIPAGRWDIAGQWVIQSGVGRQKPLKIVGAGADMVATGVNTAPSGGTILNMTYGSGPKLITTGIGLVEISGVNFYNTGTDTQPFIFTSNTVLQIHNNAFWGNITTRNDGIVLGGLTLETAFQGYGTVISQNAYQYCNECVRLKTYANAVVVRDNNVWASCGGVAAFVLDSTGSTQTDPIVGNTFSGNLIELINYTYGFKLIGAINSYFANSFYDGSAPSFAYYIGTDSSYNTLQDVYTGGPAVGFMTGDSAAMATTTVMRNQQGTMSQIGGDMGIKASIVSTTYGPLVSHGTFGTSSYLQERFYKIGGQYNLSLDFYKGDSGRTFHTPLLITTYPDEITWINGTTDIDFGVATGRIKSSSELKLWSATTWFGDTDGSSLSYHTAGSHQVKHKYLYQTMPQLALNSIAPDISTSGVFYEANTSPTTILDFTGLPKAGDMIRIVFTTGNTTITHGGGIWLKGGANKTFSVKTSLSLIRDNTGGFWVEL